MVSHSVVVRQKHVVSDFKPYKQFWVRHHHQYS
jgi:hypothetical protein